MAREDEIRSAYRQLGRSLSLYDGSCDCFYVEGSFARTDWLVRSFYVPMGFFTPPFETEASLGKRLERRYSSADIETFNSIACFACVK